MNSPMLSNVVQQRSMLKRILDGDLPKMNEADMAAGYLRVLGGFPEIFAK